MNQFNLDDHPYVALCDLLKIEGWCDSGGAAKTAIEQCLVKVDGQIETRKRCKITRGQIVSFAGQQLVVV
ncbi:ribosome-associated protein YbcJ [Alkanindiges illinoisensis]|uniref:ribosome-associated protein YbcJ n=1 Tax=Alkanindiges illinoisensis TaxID=197183 RepID=UPI00047D2322|nr:ribosome-associated protein YbcJ [Alkanindiges illinoisensis]